MGRQWVFFVVDMEQHAIIKKSAFPLAGFQLLGHLWAHTLVQAHTRKKVCFYVKHLCAQAHALSTHASLVARGASGRPMAGQSRHGS